MPSPIPQLHQGGRETTTDFTWLCPGSSFLTPGHWRYFSTSWGCLQAFLELLTQGTVALVSKKVPAGLEAFCEDFWPEQFFPGQLTIQNAISPRPFLADAQDSGGLCHPTVLAFLCLPGGGSNPSLGHSPVWGHLQAPYVAPHSSPNYGLLMPP